MPGRGTTGRKVRVDDELWPAAQDAAAAYGTNAAEVMREALVALVERHHALGPLDGAEVRVRVDVLPVAS